MNRHFEPMERCAQLARQQDDDSLHELFQLLSNPDWMVRFAAAVALGDRADPRAIEPLLALLRTEDAAPLYTQDQDIGGAPAGASTASEAVFPEATSPATRAAWERRGRLKQAACFALAEIGVADPQALEILHRYATDAREDYTARAAAARTLGRWHHPSSRSALAAATNDSEWCTQTEAAKALALYDPS